MKISVAICTWNRATLLERTLAELALVRIPPDIDWEVVVVNNNSTDTTDAVLRTYVGRLPLRHMFEGTSGHSHARNRAIAEARGDVIVWTDDDVLVDRDWVSSYAEAFHRNPSIAFFAGPVEPWFESPPPSWMTRHLQDLSGVIVCVNHGAEVRALQRGDAIFGANMAVRRDVALRFPFDTQLGRMKDVLTGGDDTDFVDRMLVSGLAGQWVPGARVRHFVPRQRMTTAYLRRWYRDAGRTVIRKSPAVPGPFIAGVPRWALRQYVRETATAWLWRPTRNARWFQSYRQSLILRGMLYESRLRRIDSASAPASRRPAQP